MKTIINRVLEMTLEEFAEKEGLTMEVNERSNAHPIAPFYASFRYVEVQLGCMLKHVTGNGSTPEEAIRDYAKRISQQPLVIDAYKKSRREINAPRIIR